MKHTSFTRLLIMAFLHFLAMYVLMYAMVYKFVDIYPNLNQLYMAGIMTAPMLILEILFMGAMYKNLNKNVLMCISIFIFILFLIFIRKQTAIDNKQFLKSMIPHHSGAILMCKNASFDDLEIKQLCQKIIPSQQAEIDQMKQILERLDKNN